MPSSVTSLTDSDEAVFCAVVLWRFLSAVRQGLFLCLNVLERHVDSPSVGFSRNETVGRFLSALKQTF